MYGFRTTELIGLRHQMYFGTDRSPIIGLLHLGLSEQIFLEVAQNEIIRRVLLYKWHIWYVTYHKGNMIIHVPPSWFQYKSLHHWYWDKQGWIFIARRRESTSKESTIKKYKRQNNALGLVPRLLSDQLPSPVVG